MLSHQEQTYGREEKAEYVFVQRENREKDRGGLNSLLMLLKNFRTKPKLKLKYMKKKLEKMGRCNSLVASKKLMVSTGQA